MRSAATPSQRGFSLLEVMVAGAILSSGLAGLAALLLTTVTGTAQSGHRTTATLLANGLAAQIEVSPSAVPAFLVQQPPLSHPCDAHNTCTADQYATENLGAWKAEVSRNLPQGDGIVCRDNSPFDGRLGQHGCDGGSHLVIKIFWQPRIQDGSGQARIVKVIR